ncbi:bifunctional diaminohydroxyphosphoribosylaminopyrimidine deaminase/5-amino-6-(5-phosphoribosylamino)uracil reductase RibD [Uliginosibacterium sediminicola]|uniref:Riboflavin biosynthesis protein RibD n=1 Tax=Uliginosibacterium sediminicola TaxID=2024550 RepID=A0ABU9YZW8_9RHOO
MIKPDFMRRALQLAERGLYTTSPNPRVGCVIVNAAGEIIGEGWTQPAGQNHAEIQALNDAAARGHSVAGATVYVTLEPCAHFGRTPPCCDALIRAGVGHVVSAMSDPNPLVAGQGLARIAAAGIGVTENLLADEALALNRGFVQRMTQGRPLLRLKIAASLDGRTALANGESQWITGEAARADGHHWRARSCAILTGIGTVLADDPLLNVRAVETPRQPTKVIVDSQLRMPPGAAILRTPGCLIATTVQDAKQHAPLLAAGAEILVLPAHEGRVDLQALVAALAKRNFNEVHVEAGAILNGALLSAGCADELLVYLAPTLLGPSARAMLDFPALPHLAEASRWQIEDQRLFGTDLRLMLRRA